ncbi:MAG: tetratricopeptide repeat protein, partial [Nitrospiria bacterium]
SRLEIYEALADLHAERGLTGNAVEDYLKAAKHYMRQDDVRASLSVYRKLANLDPENFDVRLKIAEMCQKEGFVKEAIEEYEKVLTLYEGKEMISEAEEIQKTILKLDPSYVEKETAPPLEETPEEKSETPFVERPESLDSGAVFEEESEPSVLAGPTLSEGDPAPSEPELSVEVSKPSDTKLTVSDGSLGGEESSGGVGLEATPSGGEETPLVEAFSGTEKEPDLPQEISEASFKGYLTEAEVYFKYGLNSKAIEQLLLVTRLCPTREEPHLKLKEIYLQEGITEKVVDECCQLARLFQEKGDEERVRGILDELSSLDPEGQYQKALNIEIPAAGKAAATASATSESGIDVSSSLEGVKEAVGPPQEEGDLVTEEAGSPEEKEEPLPVGAEDEASLAESSEESYEEFSQLEDQKEVSVPDVDADKDSGLPPSEASVEKEDYVNLASMLSEELGGQLEESSDLDETVLEGAFNELKKVAEVGGSEKDIETHYDLGIAYKEMEMIPEAIKEFELACQGDHRFQDASIMLASCYRARGAINTAIKAIQRALDDSRCNKENTISLKYEMAILLGLSGDKGESASLYEEIYRIDPTFRDVKERRNAVEPDDSNRSISDSKEETTSKSNTESRRNNRISYL